MPATSATTQATAVRLGRMAQIPGVFAAAEHERWAAVMMPGQTDETSGALAGETYGPLPGFGNEATADITGTENGETLNGTPDADTINGLGGNDILNGLGGADMLNGGADNDTLDGGTGADTMNGGTGDDLYLVDNAGDVISENADEGTDEIRTTLATYSLAATPHIENLTAPSASGTLTGNGLANLIIGGSGNTMIDGGVGADTMVGRTGNDTYVVDDAGDIVVEEANEGTDEVRTSLASYSIASLANIERLTGTSGAGQTLTGNGLANIIGSGAGNDTLIGGGGDDTFLVSIGADSMSGGTGYDFYVVDNAGDTIIEDAGEGFDRVDTSLLSYTLPDHVEELHATTNSGHTFTGNAQDNFLYGLDGNDTLIGGDGADFLSGWYGGVDILIGGAGNDDYYTHNFTNQALDAIIEEAGQGIDTIHVGGTSDYSIASLPNIENLKAWSGGNGTLTGNDADNVITGNGTLYGGGGNDSLSGGSNMFGGSGNDIYNVGSGGAFVSEAANEGIDEIRTTAASYSIAFIANVENLSGSRESGPQTLTGNDLDNVITVDTNTNANELFGGGGNDTLIGAAILNGGLNGGAGNDILIGDIGGDRMTGGTGDDVYYVTRDVSPTDRDQVIENAGEGTDEVRTALASYSLVGLANVENLTGLSTIAQTLTGNSGANVIDGGGGADTMTGGLGNDVYVVDDAGDVVIENAGEGTDEIRTTLANYSLASLANIENLTGLSNLAQTLTGNAAENVIDGGGGADTMTGGLGNDSYVVDDAGDVVTENAGEGTDEVRTTLASYSLASLANVENLTGLSALGQALTGSAGNNVVTGGSGNDLIDGGAGTDTMAGGAGNDTFVVDNAADNVIELVGGGSDYVLSYLSWTLGAGSEVETVSTANHGATTAINLTGNAFANTIYGNNGANILNGGGGADRLAGFGGDDFYVVYGGEKIFEGAGGGADQVIAYASFILSAGVQVETLSTANDAATDAINLTGNAFANTIYGNNGANVLDGGAGADRLLGLGGNDQFAFTTALGGGNVDQILDMSVGSDKILLDDAVFAGLGLGTLAAGAFNTGAAAQDADDRILYDAATGALYFDSDGAGGAAAVQFASLSTGLAMTASEFTVI